MRAKIIIVLFFLTLSNAFAGNWNSEYFKTYKKKLPPVSKIDDQLLTEIAISFMSGELSYKKIPSQWINELESFPGQTFAVIRRLQVIRPIFESDKKAARKVINEFAEYGTQWAYQADYIELYFDSELFSLDEKLQILKFLEKKLSKKSGYNWAHTYQNWLTDKKFTLEEKIKILENLYLKDLASLGRMLYNLKWYKKIPKNISERLSEKTLKILEQSKEEFFLRLERRMNVKHYRYESEIYKELLLERGKKGLKQYTNCNDFFI